MATPVHAESLHRLKTAKGHLTAFMSMALAVMEDVGERSCGPMPAHLEKPNLWGEVLYKHITLAAFLSTDLEKLTNELRTSDGLKPLDYTKSTATQIIEEFNNGLEETAKELGIAIDMKVRPFRF